MSFQGQSRVHTRRTALGDATRRINNSQSYDSSPEKLVADGAGKESLRPDRLPPVRGSVTSPPASPTEANSPLGRHFHDPPPSSNAPNPHPSTVSKEGRADNSNRNSQISTASTNASDGRRRKTHIGPWHLGKTLGKGATARVRMARHASTGQPAAIKIVQKKNAQLSQAGSLASLDKRDATFVDSGDGFRRMPYGIEREVAIMKLIEHPHIMKLYDIWENRTEIYLVLEFVDNGELFEHISRSGRLPEEEALKYFRQLLSAVGCCHDFKICHRDLKPENILLTKHGDIRIADFGMAALQQSPEHKLQTSCGSPHYAAPEVIKAIPYQGAKVDIWSMGVILYAELSGRLPFDNPTLPGLLAAVQKGQYRMPSCVSPEAADLIQRMLRVDARDRISIRQIWRHPLLKKYDYLDDFGEGVNPKSPEMKNCGRPVLRRSDIDRELLRHLRSMWHQLDEQKIINLLLNEQPNDQKLFYTLLLRHREQQLENYLPDIGYSNSDYHHTRSLSQVKKLSTRNFVQPSSQGHGRQVSRFTVVSNVGKSLHGRNNSAYTETDVAETVQSYDPFKASRPQNLIQAAGTVRPSAEVRGRRSTRPIDGDTRNSGATHLVDARNIPQAVRQAKVTSANRGSRQSNLVPPRIFSSRSSLASSTRSRGSTSMRASNGYKRGVSFSHLRKFAAPSQTRHSDGRVTKRHSKYSEVTDDDGDVLRAVARPPHLTQQSKPRQALGPTSEPVLSNQKPDRISRLWHEDVRQLSTSLAKDCDEAFNGISKVSTSRTDASAYSNTRNSASETSPSSIARNSNPHGPSKGLPHHFDNPTARAPPDRSSWDARPLPPPPTRSESTNIQLAEARRHLELRKLSGGADEPPGHLDRMVSHIDGLMKPNPSTPVFDNGRRAVSAPANPKGNTGTKSLPLSYELSSGNPLQDHQDDCEPYVGNGQAKVPGPSRTTSAPQPQVGIRSYFSNREGLTHRRDAQAGMGIRLVQPSHPSPAKAPAPLNIQKKSSPEPQPVARGLPMPPISEAHGRTSQFDLRQQYANSARADVSPNLGVTTEGGKTDDSLTGNSADGIIQKRKSNWFKKSSRLGVLDRIQAPEIDGDLPVHRPGDSCERDGTLTATLPTDSKRGFGIRRFFKKRVKKDGEMGLGAFEIFDDDNHAVISTPDDQRHSHNRLQTNVEQPAIRHVEPQQNWLARLFHVRPASRFMCFSVSKRRARQEIVTLLKQWRKYGTKDIVVDKERNIVFGKVDARNYLQMKEVSFASEIMTVIEHGKRSQLSIARFTQEKGAASSFYKVVETLEIVLKSLGLLVADERKRRMMIKTLNALA